MTRPARTCVLDFESRSVAELGRGGTNAFNYAMHPTTGVWMACYAFDDDPDTVLTWWPDQPMPADLREHVETGGVVSAHSAGFEYAIWNFNLVPRNGWAPLPIEQMDDTAARAARCGLPRSLEKAAPAAGIPIEKDMKGAAQMKRMAKPRKVHDDGSITWWDVPDRVERLHSYCQQDVRVQMALHQTLPPLPDAEREIWLATMRANIRGVQIDVPFVNRAIAIVNKKLDDYAKELLVLTDGQVSSHTDLNGMKRWLDQRGHAVDSLDKNVVAAMVADDALPEDVRRVVSIRAEAGKSSVAKYPAMRLHADEDHIARDLLVYYGAIATGRWSGQAWQVHNLTARGEVRYTEAEFWVAHTEREDVDSTIDIMETLHDGSVLETLSMCLRSAIRARDGMDIVCADFSNIEGRDAAWLGGEAWKLNAFRAFDAGTGPDLYKVAAGGILGIAPEDVEKPLRNSLGKVSELALQFQGGVGAFLSMAAVYGVQIADYWGVIREALPGRIIDEAREAFEAFGRNSGTERGTWIAAEAVKRAWREKHPGIVQGWYDCESSAIAALRSPGAPHYACDGKLAFLGRTLFGKPFLLMRLPSGRCIHYANARLRERETPWGSVKAQITFDKVEQGRIIRSATYGGDLFQSAVQGSARDIMAHGWLNTEAAGYKALFSVHDELASEYPEGQADLHEYERLLCDLPAWAQGCPVTAEGYVAKRFRKD